MELPQGATPLDFAYMIHSDVGHQCVGAKVNGHMVPLRYHLQSGDTAEILTSRNQTPHMDWLDIVVSGRARTRIRQKLRDLEKLPGAEPGESRSTSTVPRVVKPLSPKAKPVDEETRNRMIRVDGQKDMVVSFAKCCNPMPGDALIGYITKRQGITIHRTDCRLLEKADHSPERIVAATWEGDTLIETTVNVTMGSRPNGLADLTNAIRPMNVDILRAEYKPGSAGEAVFEFHFQTTNRGRVERVIRALRLVTGVHRVEETPVATEMAVGK